MIWDICGVFIFFTAGMQCDPLWYFITSITMKLWLWKKQNIEWVNDSCSMNKMTTWEKNESSLNMIDGHQGWHYLKNLILPFSPSPPLCSPLVFSQLRGSTRFFFSYFPSFLREKALITFAHVPLLENMAANRQMNDCNRLPCTVHDAPEKH